MNRQTNVELSQASWNEISHYAEVAFPDECCGVIFARGGAERVVPLENIQNKLHDLDPEAFPRTAATAYNINALELDKLCTEAKNLGEKFIAFYHSHPDHDPYFSVEDKAFAIQDGEPTFPGTAQIVVSLDVHGVQTIKAYAWSREKKDFIEVPIRRI
jgi:proteasome lid subunit RPN8/RPN11